MKEKLDNKLETNEITQTRNKTVEASATTSASPGSKKKRSLLPFEIPLLRRSLKQI